MTTEYEIHPLAHIYPMMTVEEFEALKRDIAEHGVREQVTLYEGKILDGRHRYRAVQELEAEGTPVKRFCLFPRSFRSDEEALAFVHSMNFHRRHLTSDQKRELIASHLTLTPWKSDRQIAEMTHASPTTVGTVRREMEKAGDVSKLDTRTDALGRQQPARKEREEQGDVSNLDTPPLFRTSGVEEFFGDAEAEEQEADPPTGTWRGYVGKQLETISHALRNIQANLPGANALQTQDLGETVAEMQRLMETAFAQWVKLPTFETPEEQAEVIEAMQAEERTEHPDYCCAECDEPIPMHLVGSPVEHTYPVRTEAGEVGSIFYLQSGIALLRHAGSEDEEEEELLCRKCAAAPRGAQIPSQAQPEVIPPPPVQTSFYPKERVIVRTLFSGEERSGVIVGAEGKGYKVRLDDGEERCFPVGAIVSAVAAL